MSEPIEVEYTDGPKGTFNYPSNDEIDILIKLSDHAMKQFADMGMPFQLQTKDDNA